MVSIIPVVRSGDRDDKMERQWSIADDPGDCGDCSRLDTAEVCPVGAIVKNSKRSNGNLFHMIGAIGSQRSSFSPDRTHRRTQSFLLTTARFLTFSGDWDDKTHWPCLINFTLRSDFNPYPVLCLSAPEKPQEQHDPREVLSRTVPWPGLPQHLCWNFWLHTLHRWDQAQRCCALASWGNVPRRSLWWKTHPSRLHPHLPPHALQTVIYLK